MALSAALGEPVEQRERGRLVRRPAEYVAAEHQRGDVKIGASELAMFHEAPLRFALKWRLCPLTPRGAASANKTTIFVVTVGKILRPFVAVSAVESH